MPMKIIRRNLSLISFVLIYLIISTTLIFLESFQGETQWNVFSTFAPFFLLGIILDYLVSRNQELTTGYKFLSQLLPSGIFLIYGISLITDIIGRPPIEAFNYIIWLFVAVPLFIISHYKDNYRRRMFSSILGVGFVGAVYLHFTTITDELNKDYGLMVYLICLFIMFYAVSGVKKIYYLSSIIGLIDAIILLYIRKHPITDKAKVYGWDFDIAYNFEMILLTNLIICLLFCFLAELLKAKIKKKRL